MAAQLVLYLSWWYLSILQNIEETSNPVEGSFQEAQRSGVEIKALQVWIL